MKVSRQWLQKFFDEALPNAEALAEALTFHAFEIDGVAKAGQDDTLDVKVTPNRGHDCLSHRGIAGELSAILKIPFAHDPFISRTTLDKKTDEVTVEIEDPALCSRYIAGYIKGVKVGPSPQWLQERLEAIGQRSINNVVDATNFVMCNTGQPLHAFDARRLQEIPRFNLGSPESRLHLGVRLARAGEVLEALDKKKYALADSMLIITAGDRPVGIAGIKGGMADRIDESTRDVVIEAATFDGPTIRRAAAALKLRTDASARFEQGLSPELAARGMANMLEFVAHVTGGEVAGFVDTYPAPQQEVRVRVAFKHINAVFGTTLTPAEVADVFTRLRLSYKEEAGEFEVVAPLERLDITIAEDLVEEVARIIGYDKVSATPLPTPQVKPAVNENFAAAEAAREELMSRGYSEVYTSVFAAVGERAVANKVGGERPYLRTSLLPGLEDALKKNIPNKDLLGLLNVKLFEIGTVWQGGKEYTMVATVGENETPQEKPLEPAVAEQYDISYQLSSATRYRPFSRYPYIVHDVALWVPGGTGPAQVRQTITNGAGELAVAVRQFDEFSKEGRVSLAYRIVFQSFERTLTEAEVNTQMEQVYAALKSQGYEIR